MLLLKYYSTCITKALKTNLIAS